MKSNLLIRSLVIVGLAVSIVACGKDKPKDGAGTKDSSKTTAEGKTDGNKTPTAETGGSGEKINSEEGKFNIAFPAGYSSPQQQTQPVPTALGSIDMKMYTSMSERDSGVAMVAYANFPEAAIKATSAEKLLDATRDGGMKNMGATVESEEKIELDGHPGRVVKFKGLVEGNEMKGRIDYYLVDATLYQVLYMDMTGDKRGMSSPATESFFKSFALNETKAEEAK